MMETQSINRLFRGGDLKRDMFGAEVLRPGKALNIARGLNAEIIEGRIEGRAKSAPGAIRAGYGKKLHSLIGASRKLAQRTSSQGAHAFDPRQRAIVKIHYFSHAGGGGAALRAHAKYVGREAAAETRSPAAAHDRDPTPQEAEQKSRAHGAYLARGEQASPFYDAVENGIAGGARAASWARTDRRHFRLILAPENGSKLGDLKAYTREVMRRAEAALGSKLTWVAVDHWDTATPHTHIILRGVRDDGRDLVIPREFIQHGFRAAARDVATERLGQRTRDDDRLALHREVRAHRPTRLDQWIADQLDQNGRIRIAHLSAPNRDAAATDALKGRARELQRLGLAREVERNVFQFKPDWQEYLKAMELHLDIRKSLMRERAQDLSRLQQAGQSTSRLLRPGPER